MKKKQVQRKCMIIYALGRQGVGKTYKTLEDIENYIKSDAKVGRKGKNVLIFDPNGESDYTKYKVLPYNPKIEDREKRTRYIQQFAASNTKPEIRRISPRVKLPSGRVTPDFSFDDKEMAATDILQYFRNGLIVLEDVTSYFQDFSKKELVSTLINVRHRGVDVIAHLQSGQRLRPVNWENAAVIRMHRQSTSVDSYMNKTNNPKLLKIAEFIVNEEYLQKGNKYFHLYVNMEEEKIHGVTVEQFEAACQKYINRNKNCLKDVLADHPKAMAEKVWREQQIKQYLN